MNTSRPLIPEWATTEAVILAWPHDKTDWAPWLEETRQTYLDVIRKINLQQAGVILLCRPDDVDDICPRLSSDARVLIVPAIYNDTWVRDYAFLTCKAYDGDAWQGAPVEFQFNGWGEKFFAKDDNNVNKLYLAPLCKKPLHTSNIVAEGGALEIDQQGRLLSTAQCLLNPKRNGDMPLNAYEREFKDALGCESVTIFHRGHLEGDDTDGHIDTLVRFTPNHALVIQGADNRPLDSHYQGLVALCEECAAAFPEHEQYRLPLPEVINPKGQRLPASYANYLICNNAVLAPIYQQAEDEKALAVLGEAFPDHAIIPVDCSVLIRQFGSLHCISMQVPKDTLKAAIVEKLKEGVTIYDQEDA